MSHDGNADNTLRDSEVALMDAIKTIFEILIAKKITTLTAIDKMLENQSKAYEGGEMDRALFVMGEFRRVMNDPQRTQLRDFLEKPNEGSA